MSDGVTQTTVSDTEVAMRIQDLEAGNARYRQEIPQHDLTAKLDRSHAALHQSPRVCVLSCADSRVPPEIVFDQTIGSMFVVRVAGNFADDDNQASLEYAIQHFSPPPTVIVVLGHERCGAVKAAIEAFDPNSTFPHSTGSHGAAPSTRLAALVGRLQQAVNDTKQVPNPTNEVEYEARVDLAVVSNVEINVRLLRDNEVIKRAGTFVIGGRYDLEDGSIKWVTDVPRVPWIKRFLNKRVRVTSLNGNCLVRPDQPHGVSIAGIGATGTDWMIEPSNGSRVTFKSGKGDYLHRPDQPQGVTTWGIGIGNEWTIEPTDKDNVFKLLSWKSDYLQRTNEPQGVTTARTGLDIEWIFELI